MSDRMRLILGGINGQYLGNITANCADETEEVLAAVAYATDDTLLFDWCWDSQIPLTFYGRLDDCVAVSTTILQKFLSRRSPRFECRLVEHHHAKVIWWRGHGVYIGSANLTNSAWRKNVEAGCFLPSDELTDEQVSELNSLFKKLEEHSTPLTDELCNLMKQRDRELIAMAPSTTTFWSSPSLTRWPGLVHTKQKTISERRREQFLREWHDTLQYLRDIGERVSRAENLPSWVEPSAPAGAQADQFLHAHYYKRTFEGRKANYLAFFEQNSGRTEQALDEAVAWWRNLPEQEAEAHTLNEVAPFLRSSLTDAALTTMTHEDFLAVCGHIHAFTDYSRRVANEAVNLPTNGKTFRIPQKVRALSDRIWHDRSAGGHSVTELLRHVLYGGSEDRLPERLWDAIAEQKWKIAGLGISVLGELVGWALPDRFPPRNGRTSKALKSLGYHVTVHVG